MRIDFPPSTFIKFQSQTSIKAAAVVIENVFAPFGPGALADGDSL